MDKPQVSVIVPIYNTEKYLKRCVDSIINQTYPNLEMILVDDGSTDDSGKLCDEYAKQDARIRVIHQKNGGPSTARNAGLDICNGEYIAFVDSDDLLRPDFVEKMVQAAQNQDAEIVQCRTYAFKDVLKVDNDKVRTEYDNTSTLLTGEKMCYKLLYDANASDWTCVFTKLYRRDMFSQLRFPQGRMLSEDTAVAYLLYWEAKRVVLLNMALYLYQSQRDDSLTHHYRPQNDLDSVLTMKERMIFFREKEHGRLYSQALYLHCNILILSIYRLSKQKEYYQAQVARLQYDLRKCQKALLHTEISAKKKLLVTVGWLCPGVWVCLWQKRNVLRNRKKWRNRE